LALHEARSLADALDQPVDGVSSERAVALGGEDESRIRGLPLLANASKISSSYRCHSILVNLTPRWHS
jgi:hypothetical protein